MKLQLPWEIPYILQQLEKSGFEAYVVGGAVRDTLLQKPTSDWDFTTNATPEQIQDIFPESFYENEFGTVGVARKHIWEMEQKDSAELSEAEQDQVYEITTFRTESSYSDFRRPDSVEWGKTLQEDLSRRDFTVNALGLKAKGPDEFEIIDPYNGQSDLKNRLLKTVGAAPDRFQEDALRMLRAVRFAAQLEMKIDPEIVIALQENADRIQHISWERIRDEFLKIICTDHVESALSLLATTGLLKHILPELLETKGIDQRGHHEFDVWTHSIRACQNCPSRDPIVRLATLVHDIAKPQTQEEIPDSEGEYSFYNHEVIGARVARDIAYRFRLSKIDIQRVFILVRWHMFHYQPELTDSAIRRFIRRVGSENIPDMLALREGDRVGSGSKKTSWRLEEMKQRIHDQLNQPMKITDMVVKGEDVMEILGIPPSRKVGEILAELFEEVFEDPEKNTREYLLNKLQNWKV